MASIKERNGKFCVIYNYIDAATNKKKQKWETYSSKAEAQKRKREIEYKADKGKVIINDCKDLRALLQDYLELYAKEKWGVSTYYRNIGLINNYILPLIGDVKINEINIRFLESYYQRLCKTPAAPNPALGNRSKNKFVSKGTIHDIHKILRNCFNQAVKWEIMDKNPAIHATLPLHKCEERDIWDMDTFMKACELCENTDLRMMLHLTVVGTLRMGELLALCWKDVDISQKAIAEDRACIYINKEILRVDKEVIKTIGAKDVLFVFPEESKTCKTVRILKKPKTQSSIRKVFIPRTVAEMLIKHKAEQNERKEILGIEYQDYDLIFTTIYGTPISGERVRILFNNLIEKNGLPKVVFHSLRHTSVSYKLKLNHGDVKSVQGDSGHAQMDMVMDVYSHIIDDDRRETAKLFEQEFYQNRNSNPSFDSDNKNIDKEILAKVLASPDMMDLIVSIATGKK